MRISYSMFWYYSPPFLFFKVLICPCSKLRLFSPACSGMFKWITRMFIKWHSIKPGSCVEEAMTDNHMQRATSRKKAFLESSVHRFKRSLCNRHTIYLASCHQADTLCLCAGYVSNRKHTSSNHYENITDISGIDNCVLDQCILKTKQTAPLIHLHFIE